MNETQVVPGLGEIHEIANVWYDVGLRRLEEVGADFRKMTARNTAFARGHFPLDHDFNQRGNWVFEEVVYGLPGIANPVLVLHDGPVYHNSKRAAQVNGSNEKFYIDDPVLALPQDLMAKTKRWDVALAELVREEAFALHERTVSPMALQSFQLPEYGTFRIPVRQMAAVDASRLDNPEYFNVLPPEVQVAAVLFRDQIAVYAESVLMRSLIMDIPVIMPTADSLSRYVRPFAQPLWIGSLTPGCGSCVVGCVCGNWMRGVRG